MMTKLVNQNDGHNKFYNVDLNRKAKTVTITFGRIGTKGVTAVKRFDWVGGAVDYAAQRITQKINRGYKELRATRLRHRTYNLTMVDSQGTPSSMQLWFEALEQLRRFDLVNAAGVDNLNEK